MEMWKVFDPFCKCAAYFTDEEEAFDRQKVERALRSMNSATPVQAIIEGQEMALWKVTYEQEPSIVASYYLTGEEKKIIRDNFELYLKAHAERVRVEVTARELRGVAAPEKLAAIMNQLADSVLEIPDSQTSTETQRRRRSAEAEHTRNILREAAKGCQK